jgi:GTPase SAR1 family protein/predicted nucleotidyltransferase
MQSSILCFVGPDGSGKTTLAKKLAHDLSSRNFPVKYVWSRLPYFLTFIILGLSKIFGFTQYRNGSSGTFTKFDFCRQPLKTVYPLAVFVDAFFYYFIKFAIPKKLGMTIVCDRWIPDIMIDISVNTAKSEFDQTLLGRAFWRIASKSTLTIVVTAPDRILQERRPESQLDPDVAVRRGLYHTYIQKYRLANLSSDNSIPFSCNRVVELAKTEGIKLTGPKRVYLNPKNPWARLLLMKLSVILAVNWVFQGTLIMVNSERLFRVILEGTVALASFALMFNYVPLLANVPLSLVLAHTINWLFNGNFWEIQKFSGRKFDSNKVFKLLRDLEKKEHPHVTSIAAFGSLSRGEYRDSSDLDLRVIRKNGLVNWIRTNLFVLKLRAISFVKKIPIDAFVLDNVYQIFDHISRTEVPVVIYDPNNSLQLIADRCISLERACILK